MDRKKVAEAVRLFLEAIGEDPDRPGLRETPERVARMCEELFLGYQTVPAEVLRVIAPEDHDEMVLVKNIVAIKEASGSLDQASEIASRCTMTILSGDDSLTLPLLSVGGKGVISVVANIVPRDMKAMVEAYQQGDAARARELHLKLFPLCRAMFLETNPIPVKAAMRMMGMLNGELRLPLSPLSAGREPELHSVLRSMGLLGDSTQGIQRGG